MKPVEEKRIVIAQAEALGYWAGVAPTGGYYVCYFPDGSHGTAHHIFKEGAINEMIRAFVNATSKHA